jgi:hypothetical protein
MALFDLDRNNGFSGNKYGLYDNLMDDFDLNSAKNRLNLKPGFKDPARVALNPSQSFLEKNELERNDSGFDYSFGV